MRSRLGILLVIGSLVTMSISSVALAVDGGAGDEGDAHNQKIAGIRGPVCTFCHFSASGKGEKIWVDLPLGAQTLPRESSVNLSAPVAVVCSSCHYPGNAVNARSGFILGRHAPNGHDFTHGNVLVDTSILGIGENHVMSRQAELDPDIGKLRTAQDDTVFPLRDEQKGTSISHLQRSGSQKPKDSGFTCTTCHDPHTQPNKDISGNGDYLRTKDEKLVGESNQRTAFCLQCHEDTPKVRQHGVSTGCNLCHHPHDGYYQLSQQAQLGRSILTHKIDPVNFQALPNVVAFGHQNDEEKEQGTEQQPAPVADDSALCYNCHGPTASQEMRDAGATPIFTARPGDSGNGRSSHPKAHHPMGSQAELGKAPRAPGLKNAVLNRYGQVTCTSCHNGFHRGKNLHFLREDFSNDSASLCTVCHTDKTAKDLGIQGSAHSQICGKSPNKRGECMFCHFIHDGPYRGEQQEPAIKALLRVDPVNLAWSDQAGDTDANDFEDLCFGCHSSDRYMKGTEKEGAKLQPEKYFGHRFSSVPSNMVHPTLPVSDADLDGVVDDYGAGKGKIYCSSCHDIHHSANTPYLRGKDSPYAGGGFCASCHTENPANGKSSHPIGVSPKTGITIEEFPQFAYGGKSGVCRGITSDESASGQVICLTCHSIHAAKTSVDGRIDLAKAMQPAQRSPSPPGRHGKLLVVDNFSSDQGSDLCRSCHPSHQGVIGSRHDFTDMNLGDPLSFGTCAACHIPHGSQEKTFLWTRSLAEERKAFQQYERPDYQKGVTLLCYDCHDDHHSADDDPPLSSFLHPPQDIAFSDGPGKTSKVGFYETIPPGGVGDNGVERPPVNGDETGGHYMKTSGLSETINGIDTGDKLPCDICHDPHKTSGNEVFLRNPVGVNSFGRLEASKNTRYGRGTGREICASCHGYSESNMPINTPVRLFGIDILRTPSQDQIQLAAHSQSDRKTSCTECHVHNRMAIPKSASTGPGTHNFHFKSLLSDGDESIVARQVTMSPDTSDRTCAVCHAPELIFQGGKLVFKDGKTLAETTVCDTCHSRKGYYDGVNGYSPVVSSFDHGAKDSWEGGVYEEVTVKGKSDWQLRPGKEAWCLGCHDDQPSRIQNPDLDAKLWVLAPNVAGDQGRKWGFEISGHGLPTSASYQQSGKAGAGMACTGCHSPVAKHIVNSKREKKSNFKQWQANKFRLKLKMELPRRSEEFRTSDFELCFSCHDPASVIGLPPGYYDYTKDYNPYVNLDISKSPMTRYSNAGRQGLYPLKRMGQSITIDFSKIFPTSCYNLHWNHLSLPNVDIDQDAIITPQAQSSSSGNRRTQTCYSGRCHAGTSVVKSRPSSFWDSDRDGLLDSRPSCTACHNPHGSQYISMTRDDIAITHGSDSDGEYEMIGSKKYGAYDDSMDNYNDLYCWECHAKLQRSGSSYIYYPQPVNKDRLSPEPPE